MLKFIDNLNVQYNNEIINQTKNIIPQLNRYMQYKLKTKNMLCILTNLKNRENNKM